MTATPTPHNEAKNGDIAQTVLMPGDPLRAKFVAENYLQDVTCFNTVRNMLGFTGTYNGKKVSVMGGGMGIPSIGIYSYELFHFYGVEQIIRIGSAGGLSDDVRVHDLVMGMGACTDSNYASQFGLPGAFAPVADFGLLRSAVHAAESRGISYKVGNLVSSDVFYNDNFNVNEAWKKMGCLAVEMEAAGLYMNAARCGKKALCLVTVSDHIFTGESLSANERQTSFRDMMEVALEIAP
ncbi:purine-nucleoside phosphorylase [Lachnotalea sp. AF33-28]|uniref:purine-nucleoside phosphorylase n=1 Tax=Lachnotalea sp. AF33-28 TaxID=2292046 RepID=UPI000E476E4E|nr:purine-nucleoside phosphorylase [Lachnotalea sp. AF33-28]RHP35069.1 purine-nucleoside phosphorylase [Lachnotalea sp. AF33-28]